MDLAKALRFSTAVAMVATSVIAARPARAWSPAADSYSVIHNDPPGAIESMPPMAGQKGLTCTPPNPTWTPIGQNNGNCIYRTPGTDTESPANQLRRLYNQGANAQTTDPNRARFLATGRDPNGIPINTRPPQPPMLQGQVAHMDTRGQPLQGQVSAEIMDWCLQWDTAVWNAENSEVAAFRKAQQAPKSLVKTYQDRGSSEVCTFKVIVTKNGQVSVQGTSSGIGCGDLGAAIALISMPSFPTGSRLNSITMNASLKLIPLLKPSQTRSVECQRAFGLR